MNKLYKKEGQQSSMTIGAIVTLVAGVGVAVLVLIFVGSIGGQTYNLLEDDIDDIANNVVSSESFTALLNETQQLNHGLIQSNTLTIFNATDGTTRGLGNFTIDYDAGRLLLNAYADTVGNNSVLAANYTWGAAEVRNSVKAGIVSSFDALEKTGDYVPLVVLAIIIALVLSIVLGFTAFGGGFARGGSAL